jgi:hypothetical protein
MASSTKRACGRSEAWFGEEVSAKSPCYGQLCTGQSHVKNLKSGERVGEPSNADHRSSQQPPQGDAILDVEMRSRRGMIQLRTKQFSTDESCQGCAHLHELKGTTAKFRHRRYAEEYLHAMTQQSYGLMPSVSWLFKTESNRTRTPRGTTSMHTVVQKQAAPQHRLYSGCDTRRL